MEKSYIMGIDEGTGSARTIIFDEEDLIGRVNVGDMLTRSAARALQHPAVVGGSRRLSYGRLNHGRRAPKDVDG